LKTLISFDKEQAKEAIRAYLDDGSKSKELIFWIDKAIEIVVNRHYTAHKESIPELKSLIYIKLFKVLPFYDPSRDVFTWCYSLVRNQIHNEIYHQNKDRVCVDINDMDMIEYDSEEEDQEAQSFVENELEKYFPSNRYIVGEELISYMNLLGEIDSSGIESSMLRDEEDIHKFIIFSFYYLKSDAMMMLHAYHTLFKGRNDFGGTVVALSSIHSRLPTPKQLLKLIGDYKLFLSKRKMVERGKVPVEFTAMRDSLAEYEITLKNVLQAMDGDRVVDSKVFTKNDKDQC
jgi:hypothetical protein